MPLQPHPISCVHCPLNDGRCTGFTSVEGTGSIPLMVIAEASGENESRDSLPLRPYAEAGSVFTRAMTSLGLTRDKFEKDPANLGHLKQTAWTQITITNILRGRPPQNKLFGEPYEHEAISHCQQYLDEAIAQFKPKAILALGGIAFRELTGISGKKQGVLMMRGYPLSAKRYGIMGLHGNPTNMIPVIGTVHPSFIRRGASEMFPVLLNDLHLALSLARGKKVWNRDPNLDYRKGGPDDLTALYNELLFDPSILLTYDIETPHSSEMGEDEYDKLLEEGLGIKSIQFSTAPGSGIFFDWNEENLPGIMQILGTPNQKANHNCFYRETKVLTANNEWKNIEQIQVGEDVRSVDIKGNLCDRKVTKTFHAQDSRSWVEVKVDGGYKRGTGRWGNPGVICTPDHEWISDDGDRVKAEDLLPGDLITLSRAGDSAVIFGSLLGDGSISIRQKGRFTCSHTNRGWSEAKAEAFQVQTKPYKVGGGYHAPETTTTWEISTQVGHFWRDWFYNSDRTRRWLPPSVKALAVWYGDDGCLAKGANATFSIHKYPKQHAQIREWFASQYGPCSIHNEGVIYLTKPASEKFFQDIKRLLHPSMEYKLPEKCKGFYSGWMATPRPQIGMVQSVKPSDKAFKWNAHKFCLEVQGTHTFFTRMGLVSNCWIFDRNILARQEVTVEGIGDDTMALWHHLQPDLPANLQFVTSFYNPDLELSPWKHKSDHDQVGYGCQDVDAVQRIMGKIKKDLDNLGLLEGYELYVKGVRPILDKMQQRGIYIDPVKKAAFRGWLETEKASVLLALQAACPDELKPIHPKNGFKVWPKEAREWKCTVTTIVEACALQGIDPLSRGELDGFEDETGLRLKLFDGQLRPYRQLPFLPNSSEHLKSYFRFHKIPVPKNLDDDETTGKEELKKLISRLKKQKQEKYHSIATFIESVLTYRELNKMQSTYVDGWKTDANNYVHTTFTFGPATGQLSSKSPNAQNVPKHSPLAKEFRKCITASPEHVLIEGDLRSAHALTLGWCAEDETYMTLAREDCHTFLAIHLCKLPEKDNLLSLSHEERMDYFKWFKSDPIRKAIRDKKAKPTILGYGFGLGATKLFSMNEESFQNKQEAQGVIDMLNALFPKTAAYREKIKNIAHEQGYLISKWGFIRRFYDVKHWDSRSSSMVPGLDAEAAIAFLPANSAFGKMREAMRDLAAAGLDEKYGLCNTIHDSLVFDCPLPLAEECCVEVKRIMELPATKLIHPTLSPNGLIIETEIAMGNNWSAWDPIKNPDGLKEVKL